MVAGWMREDAGSVEAAAIAMGHLSVAWLSWWQWRWRRGGGVVVVVSRSRVACRRKKKEKRERDAR